MAAGAAGGRGYGVRKGRGTSLVARGVQGQDAGRLGRADGRRCVGAADGVQVRRQDNAGRGGADLGGEFPRPLFVRERRPLRGDDVPQDAGGLRARRVVAPGRHRLCEHGAQPMVREPSGAHEPSQGHRAARLVPSALYRLWQRHRLPDRGGLFRHHRPGASAGGHSAWQRVRAADELG